MPWSTDTRFPGHKAEYGIGLHLLPNAGLLCVHRGAGSDTSLWWTRWRDDRWVADRKFPDHHSSNGAALAAYGGVIRCVHRGGATDDRLWMADYDVDADTWRRDTVIPGARCSRNPAIAEFQGRLYCVHRGWQTDDSLYYTYYDGHGWLTDTRIPGEHFCTGDVALAVYKGKLCCVHTGRANEHNLYVCWYDGTKWTDDERLPEHLAGNLEATGVVALATDGTLLYCVHKGKPTDTQLWEMNWNGTTWSPDARLSDGGHHGHSVALVVSGSNLVCVHDGTDGALWYTWRPL